MSQPSRLAERTGIQTVTGEVQSFWPLNIVLLLLGGAILVVSFYFLDPGDERLFFNPWTYAVATPILLMGLSVLLSTLVSRVVEKSMQMAFLLSVLVHLVLMVYAMNIVIFSQMWPEILNSLARERQQLKQEALQAKRYYRTAAPSRQSSRPDYLRYVPTEHQPTELLPTESPALALARADRAELESLELQDLEPSVNRDLPERVSVAADSSATDQQAAKLSGKARSVRTPSVPPDATAGRVVEVPLSVSSVDITAQPLSSLATNQAADRRNSRRGRSSALPPSLSPSDAPPSAEMLALNSAVSPSRSSRLPMMPTGLLSPRVSRAEQRTGVPEPTDRDTSSELVRSSAGGMTGPPAPSMLPVYGPQLQVGGEASPAGPGVAQLDINRRRIGRRRSESVPGEKMSQADRWSSAPQLSTGLAGISPALPSAANASGRAAAPDNADLAGAAEAIRRSASGMSGAPGAFSSVPELSVPAAPDAAVEADWNSAEATSLRADQIESAMLAAEPVLRRPSSSSAELAGETGELPRALKSPSFDGGASTVSPSRIARAGDRDSFSTSSDGHNSGFQIAQALPKRSSPALGLPEASLETLDLSGHGDSSDGGLESSSQLEVEGLAQRAAGRRSRSRGGGPALPRLDRAGSPGLERIAPVREKANLRLPPRSSLATNAAPVDLDAQRYARRDVRGPLSAGQPVQVPKPAFQQRLERLRDRSPLATAALEPQTELAIERGLMFLARHQREDGCWRLQDFDTPVLMRSDTAATGLALLAFQGAGYTHQQFRYADTVGRAIQFLRQNQTADGDLYIPQDPASDQNARLYSHAIATIALCEAYGMTQDPELREPAQRSLDFMIASQDPERGGWRYRPGRGSDTSVTGWFVMALKSGQLAGLSVPERTYDRIRGFLELSQVSADRPHLYRYNPYAADTPQQRHGLKPTAVMTSVGLLMRLYLGWQRDRTEMMNGTDFLLQHLPEEGSLRNSRRDTYYWYYATQVLFHMGGQRWQRWHDELYPMLIRNQITSGEDVGSWDPFTPTPDLWARYGGRLYVTTMNLLSLEVSYRHLPLYDATGYQPIRD